MKYNLKQILTNEAGMDVAVQAVMTINFWSSVVMKQAIDAQIKRAHPADLEEIRGDEADDEFALDSGGQEETPVDVETAANVVLASYVLGHQLAAYSESDFSGKTVYPHKWMIDRKNKKSKVYLHTPVSTLRDSVSYMLGLKVNEFSAKLAGLGEATATDEQKKTALARYKLKIIELAREPLAEKEQIVRSEADKSIMDWDTDALATYIEEQMQTIGLDGMKLVTQACKQKHENDAARLLNGEFVGDMTEISSFLGIKTKVQEIEGMTDDDLGDLLLVA